MPQANSRTRRLSSVVQRRCSYRRMRFSNQRMGLSQYTGSRAPCGFPVSHPTRPYPVPIEGGTRLCQSPLVSILALFLFGLVIGSFLNVCITRIPEGLSIVSPRSRCPGCGTPIRPYDNVPVLSWILLGG